MWSWIFNGQYGILNSILQGLGILETGIPWLGQTGTTLSIEVYATAFKNWNMGKAATIGTIWAVLLACFSFVYLRRVNDSE